MSGDVSAPTTSSFDAVLAINKATGQRAEPGSTVTIYEPGDTTKTPLALADPTGLAIPNPVAVTADGFLPPFQHDTVGRVAWEGGGVSSFISAHESYVLRAEEAAAAAQDAAATAASTVQTEFEEQTVRAETAAADAATSAQAATDAAALVDAPADSNMALLVEGPDTQTRTKPYTDLRLRSGDLFVFGGPSRFAYHGVPKIYPGTADPACGLASGRLNLTMRVTGLA